MKKTLVKVPLTSLLKTSKKIPVENKLLVNIRGCNGSGKSTTPLQMLETDDTSFEITWVHEEKEKVIGTVFPKYNFVALGTYHSQCGGIDRMKSTAEILLAVESLWNLNYHILLEGMLTSTVRQTYIDLYHRLNRDMSFKRDIVIYNLLPPLQLCLDRIQIRNGGRPIKESHVINKWFLVEKNIPLFAAEGFLSLQMDNSDVEEEDTLSWFLETLDREFKEYDFLKMVPGKVFREREAPKPRNLKKKSDEGASVKKSEPLVEPVSVVKEELNLTPAEGFVDIEKLERARKRSERRDKLLQFMERRKTPSEDSELFIADDEYIKNSEWAPLYKAPDGVVYDEGNRRLYWNFIFERLKIYYNRVVLKKPFPWTSDEILKEHRFTNISRDMDKLSLYEREHILSKLDEPVEDLRLRKISVFFNIILFRTFVKIESYEYFGFVDFSEKNFKSKWEKSKLRLLNAYSKGYPAFTGSYMVNPMTYLNPNKETRSNKLVNVLIMLQDKFDNIEKLYSEAIEASTNMKEQLEALKASPGVGGFTAYEYACSIAMSGRYTNTPLSPWTQDSYTNVGPGSRRGLNFVFDEKGTLSDLELIVYLRSVWKQEIEFLGEGKLEEFLMMLPDAFKGELDLRVIEHCLCEVSKYLKVYYNLGRVKKKFEIETVDVDTLRA